MGTLHAVTSILTYPGVIFRLVLTQLFCRIFRCKVKKVKYISIERPCAVVEHEELAGAPKRFWLCFLPFFFSFIIGLAILLPAALQLFHLGNATFLNAVLFWIGFSLICNMFPEYQDACAMWSGIYKNKKTPMIAKILLAPVNAVMFGGSWLTYMGLHMAVGVLAAVILPFLLLFLL